MNVKVVTGNYQDCLDELKKDGFEHYVDNGENGLNGNVFTTTLVKENQTATVIYEEKKNITYVVEEENATLSEHLFFKKEYIAENKEGAQTTLHMLETYRPGSSFVIQLKNQHFIICDGGYLEELPYLISYLESLVPKGVKPVVEAWMITHPHHDHVELFKSFENDESYADRICVEGIYLDVYSDEMQEYVSAGPLIDAVETAAKILRTKIYRPHAGQRYYFSDITVDIMQTMVQVPREKWFGWKKNMNEMSTWFMFTIEGQKFLNAGDADLGSMKEIMETYDKEYLEMELMSVHHHGVNVHKEFTDFIKVKTLLYSYYGIYGAFKEGQEWPGSWQASVYRNEYLHSTVEESMSYGDGTKVLTFPYKVGAFVSLPRREERFEFTGTAKERRIEYQ